MQWQAVLSCRAYLGIGRFMGATGASPIAPCSCALSTEDLCQQSTRNPCNFSYVHSRLDACRACCTQAHAATALRFSYASVLHKVANVVPTMHMLNALIGGLRVVHRYRSHIGSRHTVGGCGDESLETKRVLPFFHTTQRSRSELRPFTADILR